MDTKVKIQTVKGDITIKLYPEQAPKTVENFLNYINSGFYDETIFHRVVDSFMIQGGGFDENMLEKEANPPIINESKPNLENKIGTIAMARTSDPHSARCQFFINLKDNDFLNFTEESTEGWGYCVFGEVVEGMEVVKKIGRSATTTINGHEDVPEEVVLINKVYLINDVE